MEKRKRAIAPHGQKMIEVTIRFWTNNISQKPGHVVKKECWDYGVVYMPKNSAHRIPSAPPVPFHSLLELLPKIEKLFIAHKVKLHPGKRSRKYLASKP
ncbi:MAG: hypothetical protein Q8L74_13015 [Nitrospirota bacterium]|nr:hypothetical protein [Nitrospirota bacterium]